MANAKHTAGATDFRYDKSRRTLIPARTGYYWARWLTPARDTHEAGDVNWPWKTWEVVQVNDNNVDDPADDEHLSVSVPGVREVQWRENFQWGLRIASLGEYGEPHPPLSKAQSPTPPQGGE